MNTLRQQSQIPGPGEPFWPANLPEMAHDHILTYIKI